MKTKELMTVLKVAKDLGHRDLRVFWEDGRDGKSELVPITASLQNTGTQMDPEVILVFKRSNE